MNCQQFQQVVGQSDPLGMSRGERAAVNKHFRGCSSCRLWFLAKADGAEKALAEMTGSTVEQVQAESRFRVMPTLIADVADPEYTSMVYGENAKTEDPPPSTPS